jgi:hypothetical protein
MTPPMLALSWLEAQLTPALLDLFLAGGDLTPLMFDIFGLRAVCLMLRSAWFGYRTSRPLSCVVLGWTVTPAVFGLACPGSWKYSHVL